MLDYGTSILRLRCDILMDSTCLGMGNIFLIKYLFYLLTEPSVLIQFLLCFSVDAVALAFASKCLMAVLEEIAGTPGMYTTTCLFYSWCCLPIY